jgi:hypothetical protein
MRRSAGRIGMVVAVGSVGVALVAVPAASAKGAGVKHWRFGTAHHLSDSKSTRITDGDFFSGRARLIDNFTAASHQRFRNTRHGRRKRVYLIRGTVAIRNKKDYAVAGASCRTSVGKGAFMLLTTRGQRAFFPRQANHIKQHTSEGSIGLSIKALSISLPFPAFTYYESTSVAPNVAWASLSSRVHNWSWSYDDGNPRTVLLGYAGYWAGSASKLKYKVKCRVANVTQGDHLSYGTLRMTRTARR